MNERIKLETPWWASEATWEHVSTLVDKKGKIKIEIKVDNVQDVGMHGSAEAGGGVKLDEVADEATARPLSDSPDLKVDEIQHIRTYIQLKGIPWALR